MQVSMLRYPSINAKLDGMYAQKIKKEQFDELLKQSNIKQAISLLKSFNDDFNDLEDDFQRVNIKMLLDNNFIDDIQKIYRQLHPKDRKVFMQYISVYEMKCIKSTFRKLSSNNNIIEQTNEIKNWVNKIFKNLNRN